MHCTDYHIVNGLISALVNPRGYRYHMHNRIKEASFHIQKEEKKKKGKLSHKRGSRTQCEHNALHSNNVYSNDKITVKSI